MEEEELAFYCTIVLKGAEAEGKRRDVENDCGEVAYFLESSTPWVALSMRLMSPVERISAMKKKKKKKKVWTIELTVDGELTSSDGADQEETGTKTAEAALETEILSDLDETGGSSFAGQTLGLVDLAQHGIGGLRDDGSGKTSDETGSKVDTSLGAITDGVLVDLAVDGFGDLFEHDEFGHGVRDPGFRGLVDNRDIKMDGSMRLTA
jgi:hypothetical protein